MLIGKKKRKVKRNEIVPLISLSYPLGYGVTTEYEKSDTHTHKPPFVLSVVSAVGTMMLRILLSRCVIIKMRIYWLIL